MFYPVANTITVQRDRVVMNVDWMDTQREYRPHMLHSNQKCDVAVARKFLLEQ